MLQYTPRPSCNDKGPYFAQLPTQLHEQSSFYSFRVGMDGWTRAGAAAGKLTGALFLPLLLLLLLLLVLLLLLFLLLLLLRVRR